MKKAIKGLYKVLALAAVLCVMVSCTPGKTNPASGGQSSGKSAASADGSAGVNPESQMKSEETNMTNSLTESAVKSGTGASSKKAESSGPQASQGAASSGAKNITVGGRKYSLTFEDDFSGTSLDLSKWSRCPQWERADKNTWRNNRVKLDGKGSLVLEAGKDGEVYSSGAVRTHSKFDQVYGYYEIRCRLQQTTGFWSAFWLMGYEVGKVGDGGKDGAEIDIFESFDKPGSQINHGVHWDGYEADHKSEAKAVTVPGIYEGWHTFALEWTKTAYIFYIDGVETWRTDAGGICETPLYVKVSTEVGFWAGQMQESDPLPNLLVDYVRVYQAAD